MTGMIDRQQLTALTGLTNEDFATMPAGEWRHEPHRDDLGGTFYLCGATGYLAMIVCLIRCRQPVRAAHRSRRPATWPCGVRHFRGHLQCIGLALDVHHRFLRASCRLRTQRRQRGFDAWARGRVAKRNAGFARHAGPLGVDAAIFREEKIRAEAWEAHNTGRYASNAHALNALLDEQRFSAW